MIYTNPAKTALVPTLMLLAIMTFSISPCLAEESDWSSRLFQDQGIEQSDTHTSLYDLEPAPAIDQNMTGFEAQTKNNPISGWTIFDNSFDQQSENLGADYQHKPLTSTQWYFDFSGGRINGDEEAHEDEISQNHEGTAEAILPTVGYQKEFFAVEFSEQGLAAAMITAWVTF